MGQAAGVQELKGVGHDGEVLTLAPVGEYHEPSGVYGYRFDYGSTGIISLGDGYYYFSHDRKVPEEGYGTTVKLYRYDTGNGFTIVKSYSKEP